jgi:integrase
MPRKTRYWKNRKLPEGVFVLPTQQGDMVLVRVTIAGRRRKKFFGPASSIAIDQAIAWRNQRTEDKRLGRIGVESGPVSWSIEQYCDIYWRLHGSQRLERDGATINKEACGNYRRNLGYIKAAWGRRLGETISYLDVQSYRVNRRRQGVTDSTINREHGVITHLFNQMRRWRKVGEVPKNLRLPDENPGEMVPRPSEIGQVRTRILTKSEFDSLYMAADSRIRRIVLAEMNAPLRFEDLSLLTKDKVKTVIIDINGVPTKRLEFKGVQNKTGQEYFIPVNAVLKELIRTAPGNALLDMRGFPKRWTRAVTRAGLGKTGLVFRDLRRSAATFLHEQGEGLKTISKMLGHSNLQTTERYLGLRAENLHGASAKLATTFVPPAGQSIQMVPKSVPERSRDAGGKYAEQVEK